jgi:CPA1 family monovalent cation:H+ antiporter
MNIAHSAFSKFFALILIATIVSMITRKMRIPYAIALVLVGLLVGAPHLVTGVHLEPELLFTVLLPPLLFQSALELDLGHLKREWLTVGVYSVLGTLISTVIVGAGISWGFQIPLTTGLLFGALISPTDPISVVALFKQMGVGKRLSVIVEGESLFNDGIAVVLFGIVLEFASGGAISSAQAIEKLLQVVIGGAAVGIGIGGIASRITREFDDHLLELMLTALVAYGSYLMAESVHVSGVIAVVSSGLVVGSYGMQTGMSATTKLAVISFWEFAAFVVNSIVFLTLGIEVTVVNLLDHLLPVLGVFVLVLAARAVSIYLLSACMSLFHEAPSAGWQHVLVWGGLRGALSMALALGLNPALEGRDLLIVLTFGVVLISLLLQGLSMSYLLRKLGLGGQDTRYSEYYKLATLLVGIKGALAELHKQVSSGGLVQVSVATIETEYREKIWQIESEIAALHLSNPELAALQEQEARRIALLAEKIAIKEAGRSGIVDEHSISEVIANLDARLAALDVGSEAH